MGAASALPPSEPPAAGEVSEYRHLTRMLLRSDGLLERAEAALRRAVTANANDATAWRRLGDMQRGQGQLAEALECYRRAASLRPNDPRAAWLVALLSGTARPEPPSGHAAPFVRQTGFLAPERCGALLDLALASQDDFAPAIVNVLPGPTAASVPPPLQTAHTRSRRQQRLGRSLPPQGYRSGTYVDAAAGDAAARRVRLALIADARSTQAAIRPWFEPLLRAAFAEALPRLGLPAPHTQRIEIAMSAYLGGGFFAKHKDNGASASGTRLASFAYYFHRRPRRFSGGDLLLHDADGSAFTRIEPAHNSIVFFPAACLHEITAIEGDLEDFRDARFVVHGGVCSEVGGG